MSDLRNKYFKTLRIDPSLGRHHDLKEKSKTEHPQLLVRALDRAYELRSFEIEHYWKRATYFWGFQVAIFAAIGLLWKADEVNSLEPIVMALALLGVLTAVANVLSAYGSKFWQQNWEKHIDMLEDEVEGRLHKTIWLNEGSVSYSVSRINQALGTCFVMFWIFVLMYSGLRYFGADIGAAHLAENLGSDAPVLLLGLLILLAAMGLCYLYMQITNTRATVPTTSGEPGEKVHRKSLLSGKVSNFPPPQFILRDAPDQNGE